MNDEFKIGDGAWCSMFGWGVVEDIKDDHVSYPVSVRFKNLLGVLRFTKDGKYRTTDGSLRVLFFEEIPVPESALKRPWKPKPGEWVAVRHDDSSTWALRTFIKQQNGKYVCDFPTMQSIFAWEQCKPLSEFIEENENANKTV